MTVLRFKGHRFYQSENFFFFSGYSIQKEMGDSDQPLWGLSLYVLVTTNNDVGQVLGLTRVSVRSHRKAQMDFLANAILDS